MVNAQLSAILQDCGMLYRERLSSGGRLADFLPEWPNELIP